jgi:hypothetical protein
MLILMFLTLAFSCNTGEDWIEYLPEETTALNPTYEELLREILEELKKKPNKEDFNFLKDLFDELWLCECNHSNSSDDGSTEEDSATMLCEGDFEESLMLYDLENDPENDPEEDNFWMVVIITFLENSEKDPSSNETICCDECDCLDILLAFLNKIRDCNES